MKKYVLFILAVISSVSMFAQTVSNMITIRDYRFSMMMTLNGSATATAVYDSYGKISTNFATIEGLKYLYQGQEVDKHLSIYMFPSRMYSETEKRFYSPDPASQYFSPYLFVGGDPVNHFDEDGNEGKPIIFYQESTAKGYSGLGKPWRIRALEKEGIEAYYMPLNILASGMPPQVLKEWNGEVFIQGHTFPFGSTLTEQVPAGSPVRLKYRGEDSSTRVWRATTDLGEATVIEPEYMADRLMEFSHKSGVPLKNVTIDGCQSEITAKRIGKQFENRMQTYKQAEFKSELPEKIKVAGIRRGRYSYWNDPLTEEHTTFHRPITEELQMSPILDVNKSYKVKGIDEDGHYTSERYVTDDFGRKIPSIRGKSEFSDYIAGRIPKNIRPFFKIFKVAY